MSSTGLLGPFLFRDAPSNLTTFTGEYYLTVVQEFAAPQLQARSDLALLFSTKRSPFPLCQINEGFPKHQISCLMDRSKGSPSNGLGAPLTSHLVTFFFCGAILKAK